MLTNKLNLPSAFVNMAMADDDYKPTPKRYSCTTLLNPTKAIILSRRYFEKREEDVSDMIWMLFGQAVHYILEHHADKKEFAELKLLYELENEYTISGILDLYDKEKEWLVDYKTASIYKVLKNDYDDWEKQALIMAWLLKKNNLPCKKITFYGILKDHSKRAWKQAQWKGEDYPEFPIIAKNFNCTEKDLENIEIFIRKKIDELIANEDLPDEELITCTDEERWAVPAQWAVYKDKNAARAVKLFDDEVKAKEFAETKSYEVVYRKGESRRCPYCRAKQFCKFYKDTVAEND